jgi:hypothetical protein
VIQFNILSGKMAGTSWVARHFPVRIGRAADSELLLEEPGVWDKHLILEAHSMEGFRLKAQSQALARVNGETKAEALLRNGDLIDLGSVRMQFWLTPARQVGIRWEEIFSWATIATVTFGQVALIYWLLT